MTTENTRIVIVGAGMAGLTAAAYLLRENYSVLLLDKNDRVGGLVHTFEYAGFSFDAGPRAFVNSGMVKPMLKDLGLTWEFVENRMSIGIEDQLFRVDSMESLQDYERILKTLYPENSNMRASASPTAPWRPCATVSGPVGFALTNSMFTLVPLPTVFFPKTSFLLGISDKIRNR